MKILHRLAKLYWHIRIAILPHFHTVITKGVFLINGANFKNGLLSKGIPLVNVSINGLFQIGRNFHMNNGAIYNWSGRSHKCQFRVEGPGAKLILGDNIGISNSAIYCRVHIEIGNNVTIGNNTVIYDSNFHSLDAEKRYLSDQNVSDTIDKPVLIGDNVFIGAHCIILKGVTIGANSIIGAGSVVSGSIPPNQIWGGNPAKFLKEHN